MGCSYFPAGQTHCSLPQDMNWIGTAAYKSVHLVSFHIIVPYNIEIQESGLLGIIFQKYLLSKIVKSTTIMSYIQQARHGK